MTDAKRTRKGDASQRAWSVVQEATGQADQVAEMSPGAVARGRAGGLKRAELLTPDRRLVIARHARAMRKG